MRAFVLLVLAACPAASQASSTDGEAVLGVVEPLPSGPPLTLVWTDDDMRFAELADTSSPPSIGFDFEDLSYAVNPRGFPPGTRVSIRGLTTPAEPPRKTDVSDAIGALSPVTAVDGKFWMDPKLEIVLLVPGFGAARLAAPARRLSWPLRQGLARAFDHPVLFKGESAADPPPVAHTAIHVGGLAEVIGPAATLRDVDWIAKDQERPTREGKACPVVEGGTAALVLHDVEMVMVERKTSRVVARKVLAAQDKCPPGMHRSDPRVLIQWSDQKRWLHEQVIPVSHD